MALISLFSAGEPTFTLPDIAFTHSFLNDSHPPINAHKHHQADAPLDRNPNQIDPTENQKPKATMLALNIG